MELRLLVLTTYIGVALCGTPPISLLPSSLEKEKQVLNNRPIDYAFNIGLQGAVTQEDWDRATIFDDDPPVIEHPNLNGSNDTVTIIGQKMKTIYDRVIYAFKGIRFAEAPTGDKRFKKADPAVPYFENNTLMATHMGEKCPQVAMFGPVGAGSEDCLFLNVYTPFLPDELDEDTKLPVMMFIHGGGFTGGDASLYLPTKLLEHDVILVVIHYRLGTLGWFSLLIDEAPGNAGLWDQIEAMKWIQNNIEGFGGDRDRVTIFGESAGAASVNWHLVLPESAGLFHAVIGESGSALEHWSLDPEPLVSARLIAGRNGCPNDTSTFLLDIFHCMKAIPHEELSLNMAAFAGEDRARGEMGFRGAAPVVDADPQVTEPLVSKYPEQYFEDGDANDVPLMIGANKHEGSFVLSIMYLEYLVKHGYVNDTDYMKNQMMIDILNCFGISDQTNGIGEALVDSFIGGEITTFESVAPGMTDLAGVFFLKAGAWQTAKMHAKYLKTNAYVYSLDYESKDSMFKWLFMGHDDIPIKPGVTHSDELMFLFAFPADLQGHQRVVMNRMTALWTNFAKYWDPTPKEDVASWQDLSIPKWEPLTSSSHHYMLIEDECTLLDEYPDR